jgi:excisionase family DNA binding protein
VSIQSKTPLLTPQVIADHLAVSVDFIYKEIKGDELHAIKVGREWRVVRAEAVRYLEALQAPVPEEWRP